jgi:carboxymethylenebutenolidase
VNEQIKHRALELFERYNWITLVPDLYRGKVAIDHEEAGHLMTGLDFPNAVVDIQGAAKHLKEKLNCQKVGVIGFCMGGALALASSVVPNNQIDAVSAYYGIPSPQIFNPSNINTPVIAHFGNQDAMKGFSAPEDVDKLEKSIKESGIKDVTIYRYDGAGHAFDHEGGPHYNKSTSELAEKRTVEFFEKHL